MARFHSLLLISLTVCSAARGQARAEFQFSCHGWTVSGDPLKGELRISYDSLGTVLDGVRLNLQQGHGVVALKNWVAEKTADDELSIRSESPQTVWILKLAPNLVRISSTSTNAVVKARASAPSNRIVARLMDPQGVPVDWVGTGEVAGTYGGSYTHNVSYLPLHNPEVMYFSLGQVSGSGFHSLFDRTADMAIDFPAQTSMHRNPKDRDFLDISMPVPGNAIIHILPDYFTKTLGAPFYAPFDDSFFKSAPMVWSSWTSYYEQVRERDIVENTDWIAAHLKPYGFQYVQLDDGYDRGPNGQHYWIEKWDQQKFPHGPKWLADYVKSKGLHPGIWLVPNSYAGAVEQHPEWYVRYTNGKMVLDYSTPVLDSTNPTVLDFLRKEMSTLDDFGFEYFKFDGEHAVPKYVPGVDLEKLYDKSVDPIIAYRKRLELIRATIGPHRFIEECVAGSPLNGTGYVNSYFNGDDLYDNWQGMYPLFSSISANGFFNHILAYNMAGEGIAIEPYMTVEEASKKRLPAVINTARQRESPLTGFGTTLPEARTVVSYVALTGTAYSVASIMSELPDERVQLLHRALPTMPIMPMDLFSRGTDMRWDKFKHTTPDTYIHNYPETLDLKVDAVSGVYDVVAMTNWRSSPATRTLAFEEKLGDAGNSYVAFDFWNQRIDGVFKDGMPVEIGPHDTRVFLLHPLLGHPQLIGNSRHITGAYSVLSLSWDGTKNLLRGSSQAVSGDPYSLSIYVPKGIGVTGIKGTIGGKNDVPIRFEKDGELLKLTFDGHSEPIEWAVSFRSE